MGKDMPEGIYVSSRYFFTTPDSSLNRNFVKAYQERYKEYPDYMAGETYAGVYFIKAAIERAGTTDTEEIIKAVDKEPLAWETPEGWKIMRPQDHSVVEDCLWGLTSYNEKYGFSMPKTFDSIQGAEICRTAEELKQLKGNRRFSLERPEIPEVSGRSFSSALRLPTGTISPIFPPSYCPNILKARKISHLNSIRVDKYTVLLLRSNRNRGMDVKRYFLIQLPGGMKGYLEISAKRTGLQRRGGNSIG